MRQTVVVIVLCALWLSPAAGQDAGAGGMSPEMAEMMKKMEAAATPGANHKSLVWLVGNWTSTSKWWMMGPASDPFPGTGTSEFSWTLDGRFIRQDYKGESMGMPFIGVGYLGYDNVMKAYTQIWMDNTSTSLIMMTGQADKSGKVYTYDGTMSDPATGDPAKKIRMVIKSEGPDKFMFEMHDLTLAEGKTLMGEMVYTRKK
jgi:hypothetical protein